MRILVAEDEITIARALKVILEKNKYTADVVNNGRDALDYLTTVSYDTAVLDIMMPQLDGLEVLRKARQAGVNCPVLMLTAKSEIEDKVAGLDAGADDYLPKPFAMSELLARVRALTRRSGSYTPSVITFEGTQLDLNGYILSAKREQRLNNKEFQLMELFMKNPRRVFSTEHLMERVWGLDSETNTDVVWTYIGFLRKKLREAGSGAEIRTVRGAGYSLESKSTADNK